MTTALNIRETSSRPEKCDRDQDYLLPANGREYSAQYRTIYETRGSKMKSRVMKMAISKWKDETINGKPAKYVNKLLEVKNLTPSFVIGTTFVDMKYKPNILKEVSGNIYEAPEFGDDSQYSKLERTRIHSYSDPRSDQIMLEDDSGRLVLDGELLEKIVLVTGVVIGVLGMAIEPGIFTIVDIVYPEAADQIPRQIDQSTPNQYILMLSGLRISPSSKKAPLEILKEFIMGELITTGDIADMLRQTTELVILGNSVEVVGNPQKHLTGKDKYRVVNKSNYDAQSMELLDKFISDLLVSIPVTILPGETDPAELEYPKIPLHHSLFELSSTRRNFKRQTNPCWLEVNGVRMLITSGENINDMFKYMIPNIHVEVGDGLESPIRKEILHDSRLKLLESNMLWQCIAPTCPDTLPCYPYCKTDPFCLDETPHVYAVGCQPKFESSEMTLRRKTDNNPKVKVISVPDFQETGQCVFMNTKTLECTPFRVLG